MASWVEGEAARFRTWRDFVKSRPPTMVDTTALIQRQNGARKSRAGSRDLAGLFFFRDILEDRARANRGGPIPSNHAHGSGRDVIFFSACEGCAFGGAGSGSAGKGKGEES